MWCLDVYKSAKNTLSCQKLLQAVDKDLRKHKSETSHFAQHLTAL